MTPVPTHGLVAVICALGVLAGLLAGCSKSAVPGKPGTSAEATGGPSPVPASLCARHILRAEDLAGILNVPIRGSQPLPGDAQSCEFVTATYPGIIVSVRPGLGRSTVDDWATGKMALETRPLIGVGDSAVWLETLREVVAQKNAVLCDIQVRAGDSDLAVNSNALPGALGVLCNKIFAAY